jgi:hypothetical protein
MNPSDNHNFLQPSRKGDRVMLRAALSLGLLLVSLVALGVSFGPCKKTGTPVVKIFNY